MPVFIPILAGLGVAAAAGWVGATFFGGGEIKKEQIVAQAQEQQMGLHIEPYGVYTPTYAPSVSTQTDYSVIIESAGASIQTKKEATQTPTFTITPTIAPTQQAGQEATQAMGIDPTILVIGGAVLLGGYLLLKKKGGKKK